MALPIEPEPRAPPISRGSGAVCRGWVHSVEGYQTMARPGRPAGPTPWRGTPWWATPCGVVAPRAPAARRGRRIVSFRAGGVSTRPLRGFMLPRPACRERAGVRGTPRGVLAPRAPAVRRGGRIVSSRAGGVSTRLSAASFRAGGVSTRALRAGLYPLPRSQRGHSVEGWGRGLPRSEGAGFWRRL